MSNRSIGFIAATALSLAGCAQVPSPQLLSEPPAAEAQQPVSATASPAGGTRLDVIPLLDAHQHMMSPAAVALNTRPDSPPAVAVPDALQALLTARAGRVDAADYPAVYTPDAMLYAEEHGRWWTGQARILDSVGNFGTGYRYIPTSYALDGSAAYVAGVLKDDSGRDTHNFILGLKRGADGFWRIASEMKQPIAPPTYAPSIGADEIIAVLDDAGIERATVLSVAYWYGDPDKQIDDRLAATRAENDWTIAETQKHPDRLIPFCGVNPLDDYAIAELERCALIPAVRGIKIHRNSKFSTSDPEHLEKLKRFFRAANDHGLAIVMHIREMPGVLIDEVLPEAPDVPIQIAHMGSAPAALEMFADAIAAGKPGTRNLWFDWTQALPIEDLWIYQRPGGRIGGPVRPGEREQMAALIRRVGTGRVLYGSDMPLAWNPTPRDWWRKTVLTLPLTDEEIRDIADNLPPYAERSRR